jgi:hypothetical protein
MKKNVLGVLLNRLKNLFIELVWRFNLLIKKTCLYCNLKEKDSNLCFCSYKHKNRAVEISKFDYCKSFKRGKMT